MQRISTLFCKDVQSGLVNGLLNQTCAWVIEGQGMPTRKWDGVPCKISDDHRFLRGVYVAAGRETPESFEQEGDELADGSRFGWLTVRNKQRTQQEEAYAQGIANYINSGAIVAPGTYELCGPGIKNNRERLEYLWLYRHDNLVLFGVPKEYETLLLYLGNNDIEGIVWHYGPYRAQLTRADFGLSWPPVSR